MRLRAAGLLSQTATTSEPSYWSRFLTTFGPQYPYPTTPNLMTPSPRSSGTGSLTSGCGSWPAGCSTVDIQRSPSVRAVSEHYCDRSAHENFHIHPRGPGFCITQIETNHIVELYAA